ncbi:MAG: O-methyltransferase [Bacteriovoracia bacterium]
MQKTYFQTKTSIEDYLQAIYQPEDSVLAGVRASSQASGLPEIQVGELDGLLLTVLAHALKPKKIVEIGTLGGYSGICLARALPQDGKLYTFEVNPRNAEVAKKSFKDAGLEQKVEVFVGPAKDNLAKIESLGPFDLVFLDADKKGYVGYLDWADKNLKMGGVVLADNTFAWGLIDSETVDPTDEESVYALRRFNDALARNKNFKSTILPTGEGLSLAVKVK